MHGDVLRLPIVECCIRQAGYAQARATAFCVLCGRGLFPLRVAILATFALRLDEIAVAVRDSNSILASVDPCP